jgi:hypothetical protein
MHPQAHNQQLIAMVTHLEQYDVPDAQRTYPTARDLKAVLPAMNAREFSTTMKNLTRRQKLRIANKVKVPYCSKPVAVYGLWVGDLPVTAGQHAESLELWRTMPQIDTETATEATQAA